jgi:GAF domain-containing protein
VERQRSRSDFSAGARRFAASGCHPISATITDTSIAGHVARTNEPVRLDDAYSIPPGLPYTFNPSFDQSTGYRTRSVLAVPMRTPRGTTVGVVQLINAKRDGAIVPYSDRQQALPVSLASQAAVAVENSHLYAEVHGLFEGFVRASVAAIEARDPATSGTGRCWAMKKCGCCRCRRDRCRRRSASKSNHM